MYLLLKIFMIPLSIYIIVYNVYIRIIRKTFFRNRNTRKEIVYAIDSRLRLRLFLDVI